MKTKSKKTVNLWLYIFAIVIVTITLSVIVTGILIQSLINEVIEHYEEVLFEEDKLIDELIKDVDRLEKDINTLEQDYNTIAETREKLDIPDGDTSVKTYMAHSTITSRGTRQYEIKQISHTDKYGFKRLSNNDYLIALGTYYGKAGDRFCIELEGGRRFYATMGDVKSDMHTDSLNQRAKDNSIIEFIVGDKFDRDNLKLFEGEILSIEKVGE